MIFLENVGFSYVPQKPLMKDISLNLEKGKIYGLLGKNGMGKTTLFKLMAGFLAPTQGKAKYLQEEVSSRKPSILENILYVPEAWFLPCEKISQLSSFYGIFFPKWSQEFFQKGLEKFGIDQSEKIKHLSFGTKKKLDFLFALATKVSYILLDEPTIGMDIPSKKVFREILIDSLEEERTIVISSHMVADFNNLLDHLLILDQGKISLNASLLEMDEKYALMEYENLPQGFLPFYEEKFGLKSRGIFSRKDCPQGGSLDIEMIFNAVIEGKFKGDIL